MSMTTTSQKRQWTATAIYEKHNANTLKKRKVAYDELCTAIRKQIEDQLESDNFSLPIKIQYLESVKNDDGIFYSTEVVKPLLKKIMEEYEDDQRKMVISMELMVGSIGATKKFELTVIPKQEKE